MNVFSVYWFGNADDLHEEANNVSPQIAVAKAKSLIDRPAAKIGIIKRVIITDVSDCIVFEWEDGFITFDGEKHTKFKTDDVKWD